MPKIGLTYETNIGTRVTRDTKRRIEKMAADNYRTLSMQTRWILERYLDGELVHNVKQKITKKQDVCEPAR